VSGPSHRPRLLARCHGNDGDFEASSASAQAALALEPESIASLYLLFKALVRLHKDTEGLPNGFAELTPLQLVG
jgi:hypothetical protein